MGSAMMLAGGVAMAAAGGAFAVAAVAAMLRKRRLDALARKLCETIEATLHAQAGWDDAVRRVRAGAAPEATVSGARPLLDDAKEYVKKLFLAEGLIPPSPARAGIRTYDELRRERDRLAGRVEAQDRELDGLRRKLKNVLFAKSLEEKAVAEAK